MEPSIRREKKVPKRGVSHSVFFSSLLSLFSSVCSCFSSYISHPQASWSISLAHRREIYTYLVRYLYVFAHYHNHVTSTFPWTLTYSVSDMVLGD